jgi:hypothetical protein
MIVVASGFASSGSRDYRRTAGQAFYGPARASLVDFFPALVHGHQHHDPKLAAVQHHNSLAAAVGAAWRLPWRPKCSAAQANRHWL